MTDRGILESDRLHSHYQNQWNTGNFCMTFKHHHIQTLGFERAFPFLYLSSSSFKLGLNCCLAAGFDCLGLSCFDGPCNRV